MPGGSLPSSKRRSGKRNNKPYSRFSLALPSLFLYTGNMPRLIGNARGFSLIELLTVLAILMVLVAIAAPVYLGQRDKTRVQIIMSSAKESATEVQMWLDAFSNSEPFIALSGDSAETCYESDLAVKDSCSSIYSDVKNIKKYTNADIQSLIDTIIDHHKGKKERSPYGGQNLFVKGEGKAGVIVLTKAGQKSILIRGFGENVQTPVFSTTVTVR